MVGSSAEIKSVLKRTQTIRVNPSMSSQMHSGAALALSSGDGQIPPSGGGTPTIPAINSGAGPNAADESGSSTTATSTGGGNVKVGSASITTRGMTLKIYSSYRD